MKIRIGTRGSKLALTQAHLFINKLKDIETEIVIIQSEGDKIKDKSLANIGGKGLFVSALEKALLENKIDIAIHSGKDLPSTTSSKFSFITLKREDPSDVLIYKNSLPSSPIIGTSSPRRETLLKKHYPLCNIKLLRGNIDTRLNKLRNDEYDAIILAKAGLNRLKPNLDNLTCITLPLDKFIPASCQGIIACQYLKDSPYHSLFKSLDDKNTHEIFDIERKAMSLLKASCFDSAAIYAKKENDQLTIRGFYKNSQIYEENSVKKLIEDITNE